MNAYLYAWAILTDCIQDPSDHKSSTFLCPKLAYYFGMEPEFESYDKLKNMLPEIFKQKPETAGLGWWPFTDIESRITALENAIKLLA